MLRVLLLALLAGCASGSTTAPCATSSDCEAGFACIDGACAPRATPGDGGARDDSGRPRDAGPERDSGVDGGPPAMCVSASDCTTDACATAECVDGSCDLTAVPCDDADACTVDSCDPASGCAHEPVAVAGGTCAAPIDISAGGSFAGDSTCAPSGVSGVCGGSEAPDVALVLDLDRESEVALDARGSAFTPVLLVGAACGEGARGCGGDSLILTLPAGRHHVTLDGADAAARGAWSLEVALTPVVTDETVVFPAPGDTRVSLRGDRPWNAGDSIQGVRTTGLPSITGVTLPLRIDNSLSCDSQDMRLRINGTAVGAVIVPAGAPMVNVDLTFPAIAGPTYTVRLETTRTVGSGCGSAGIPDGSSLTFRR